MMEFFSSDLGIAIAWVCTVLAFLFGFIKDKEVKKLKLQIYNNSSTIDSSKTIETVAEDLDQSTTSVQQTGEKNVYANKVSGGMKIEL